MIAAATFSTSVEISATEKNFYSVEKFADLEILRYKVPGFEDLTPKQKELVYYLSQAAARTEIFYMTKQGNGIWLSVGLSRLFIPNIRETETVKILKLWKNI